MSNLTREAKGRAIAENDGIETLADGTGYRVGTDKTYFVPADRRECDCADYTYRGGRCKHIEAVDYALSIGCIDQADYVDHDGALVFDDETDDLPF